jgi:hypothetical protein
VGMTFDRSPDDLPLAAYGGSGMELSSEDESRIELAGTAAPDAPGDTDAPGAATLPPGPFEPPSSLDLADEPGESPGMPLAVALAGLAKQVLTLLRTSRMAAGAAFAAVILVGLLLLAGGGPKPGAAGVQASPSPAVAVTNTQAPGDATLVLTGKLHQTLAFGGMAGAGAPGSPIAATWTDTAQQTLGLEGVPDRGTRYTDKTLVLRFTIMVKQKPVTFTSDAGECTIGMAVNPTNVFGTFSCKQLKSDDGKLVVGATGTYRT